MDSALGWIGDVFRFFGKIFPRLTLVRSTHRGVKFVRDKTLEIGPGLHVYWPITTEVEIHPVVRQVISLEQQIIQTKDQKTVIADGVVVFAIGDIHRFLTENFDAEENIAELAQAGLRQAILSLTLEEIDSGRVKLDNRLTREANSALAGFGVNVESVRLQSCSEGRVLIHAGSMVEVNLET